MLSSVIEAPHLSVQGDVMRKTFLIAIAVLAATALSANCFATEGRQQPNTAPKPLAGKAISKPAGKTAPTVQSSAAKPLAPSPAKAQQAKPVASAPKVQAAKPAPAVKVVPKGNAGRETPRPPVGAMKGAPAKAVKAGPKAAAKPVKAQPKAAAAPRKMIRVPPSWAVSKKAASTPRAASQAQPGKTESMKIKGLPKPVQPQASRVQVNPVMPKLTTTPANSVKLAQSVPARKSVAKKTAPAKAKAPAKSIPPKAAPKASADPKHSVNPKPVGIPVNTSKAVPPPKSLKAKAGSAGTKAPAQKKMEVKKSPVTGAKAAPTKAVAKESPRKADNPCKNCPQEPTVKQSSAPDRAAAPALPSRSVSPMKRMAPKSAMSGADRIRAAYQAAKHRVSNNAITHPIKQSAPPAKPGVPVTASKAKPGKDRAKSIQKTTWRKAPASAGPKAVPIKSGAEKAPSENPK